jgi:hypothetical protein
MGRKAEAMSEKKTEQPADNSWVAKELEKIKRSVSEKRPPLLPRLVVHRLGVYHGDR